MTSESEMKYVIKHLKSGEKVSAIVANEAISILKRSQGHVEQLENQLTYIQKFYKKLKKSKNVSYRRIKMEEEIETLKAKLKNNKTAELVYEVARLKSNSYTLKNRKNKKIKELKLQIKNIQDNIPSIKTHDAGEISRLQEIVNRQTKIIANLKESEK